jgi:hypothetical protein
MTLSSAHPHVGTHTCHVCGEALHFDCDPKRNGWLACPTCGPVYMPLDDHYIRVHLACGEEEAARRVARLIVALERA